MNIQEQYNNGRRDFANIILLYEDLRGAVLRGAVLRSALLVDALLVDADLAGADLAGADLRGAVLVGANLEGAVLRHANLRHADLRNADLRRADLRRADLEGADLEGADLEGAALAGETPKTNPTPPPAPAEPASPLPTDSAERKQYPLCAGLLDYFPAALAEASHTSYKGNAKHNPGQPLHHARGKSMDHPDCILRHLMDYRALRAWGADDVSALREELGNLCWRALAFAQQELENLGVAPLAPGAKVDSCDATTSASGESAETQETASTQE